MPETVRPSMPVAPQLAARYSREGLWNDRGLRGGVEAAAARNPDGVALVDGQGAVSWSDLAAMVEAATTALSERAVGAGQPVVLVSGNSVEGVVAYHSLLRAGATAVVLDRRCGEADLRAAMTAVRAGWVVLPAERSRLEDSVGGASVIPLEGFRDGSTSRAAGGPVDADWPEPDRDAAAVVLFTSGTTSRPKGVTHSINTLTSGARNMALTTGADSGSVIFLVSPLASITGVMQMHLAADQHAALVLEDRFDPVASLERIARHGATLIGGAPVIVERLVAAADAHPDRRLGLRTVALGGAMLPRPLLERVMDEYGVEVSRVYGSSEAPTSTGSLPSDSREARLGDDGALLPGTEIRIGSSGHPLEGLVRGPNLFLGYLDPADNEEAFEGGWYRTGDLVDLSTQGRLTVLGRLKEVVNRNGLKISLPEVDAAMIGAPGIAESAAFPLPDGETGERLAVAVVPSGAAEPSFEGIAGYLRGSGVATRKLPEQVVIWDGPLPRTPSGKVVRSQLASDAPAKRSLYAPRLHPEHGRLEYEMRVEAGKLAEYARAALSGEPRHFGPEAVAHPTFLTTGRLLWEPPGVGPVDAVGFDPPRMLHGEEEFVFHEALPEAGDTLQVTTYIADRWEKQGTRGGSMRFALIVNEFRDQAGTLVAEQRTTMIETAPREAE